MPVYLDEYMMGTDPATIGFPHLLVCMGVLCMTGRNLYGVHLGVREDTDKTIAGFQDWLGSLGVSGGDIKSMYASANLTIRYDSPSDPKSKWQAEMKSIAGRLGYRGAVYGFDTSVISPQDGTYVEYQSELPKADCRIFYKRNEKIRYTTKPYPVKQLAGGAPSMAQLDTRSWQLKPAEFVRDSASIMQGSKMSEVNYAVRLMKYVPA